MYPLRIYTLKSVGNIARMEESKSTFNIVTGTLTGKRPLGRPRCIWED